MSRYLSVRDLDVEGRRVFLRLDLNVPIRDGVIRDDTRIRSAMPTLIHLLDRGARVVACSHLGRPKGRVVPELSLYPVAERLRDLLPGRRVFFARDVLGPDAMEQVGALKAGECLLLENIRFEPGETKGDPALARSLRELADLCVIDAFGAVHRPHASVFGAPGLFPQVAMGFLLERELEYLQTRLGSPEHPYTAVLGGAKVSDKIPVIRRLLDKVDALCIGGGMAFTFLAAKGITTGKSLLEPELVPICRELLELAAGKKVQVLLPVDHVAAPSLEPGDPVSTVGNDRFPADLAAFDIGPETAGAFSRRCLSSRTIFWNGPMGVFEQPAFSRGTSAVARALADSGALTVIGGGDSVAAIHAIGLEERISHISTGGGASLELLAGEELPGVQVLTRI